MIKLKEVLDKYGDYLVDEEQLEKIVKKPVPKSVWDLKTGDIYWCIDSDGLAVESVWEYDKIDDLRLETGNVFLTQEEVDFEVERRKCESVMLKYGTRDMMSLGDSGIPKHCICYNHVIGRLTTDWYGIYNPQGLILFETEELAKKAIDEIGEEHLKKYIFNVKE